MYYIGQEEKQLLTTEVNCTGTRFAPFQSCLKPFRFETRAQEKTGLAIWYTFQLDCIVVENGIWIENKRLVLSS